LRFAYENLLIGGHLLLHLEIGNPELQSVLAHQRCVINRAAKIRRVVIVFPEDNVALR